MTDRRDPIERVIDRLQDFAVARATLALLIVLALILSVLALVFMMAAPVEGLPGRLLIFVLVAIGSALFGLARWVWQERRYLAKQRGPKPRKVSAASSRDGCIETGGQSHD